MPAIPPQTWALPPSPPLPGPSPVPMVPPPPVVPAEPAPAPVVPLLGSPSTTEPPHAAQRTAAAAHAPIQRELVTFTSERGAWQRWDHAAKGLDGTRPRRRRHDRGARVRPIV